MHHVPCATECPRCRTKLRTYRFIGEPKPIYTDGAWTQLAPLVACPHCQAVFSPTRSSEPADQNARSTDWVTPSMAMKALAEGCDKQTEIAILLARWQHFNLPLHGRFEPFIAIPPVLAIAFGFVAFRLAALSWWVFAGYELCFAFIFGAITVWACWAELETHRHRRKQRLRYFADTGSELATYRDIVARENPFRANLLRLQSLLDHEDRVQRLFAAEVARQLGHFPEAIALVGRDDSMWAATIAAESREGRRFVTAVRSGSESK